jgi:taurine--2-oxoglutarate transaminase
MEKKMKDKRFEMDPAAIGQYEREYVLHSWSAQKSFKPFIIARAKGSCFWDEKGKRYLDFCSQLVNVNAGHQHPKIIQAIKDQADKICYVGPAFANERRAELGRLLAEVTPGDLTKSFLTIGGGPANEDAIKIARAYTGRNKIITRWRSYHGATQGAIAASGDPRRLPTEPGVPGFIRIWDPYCYKCFFKQEYPECNLLCCEQIREVIEVEGPGEIAAIMVEPITASNCRIVPPDGYLQLLRKICDEYGILLIFDEVMTGFGRTGEWFACNHWNVVPDIMTMAKGIDSAYVPLGATIVTSRVAEHFEDNTLYDGLTNFGHPLACAAAIAAIHVYREEKMVENSRAMGQVLMRELERMKEEHPCVGDVRGKGLFAAIELVKDKETRERLVPWTVEYYEKKHPAMGEMLSSLKEEGVHTYARWNVLMIAPPLCITEQELMEGLEKIDKALTIVDKYISTT